MHNGSWQGDVLSNYILAFNLKVIHERAINSAVIEDPTFKILAAGDYLDDNQTLATLKHLNILYKYLVIESKIFNMKYNIKKCELIINNNIKHIPEEFSKFKIYKENMECLNIPLGDIPFIESVMDKKIKSLNELLDKINMIHDKQIIFHIINKFNNINKINYFIRNVTFNINYTWIKSLDDIENRKRNILLGSGLSINQINQCQLAIRHGGLALRTYPNFIALLIYHRKLKILI
jgi:hypothetical protein